MIQVLGIKRILVLIILVAINAALAAGLYLYLVPQNDQLERDLRSTRAQIASKRTEADALRNEIQLIQQQKSQFEDLRDAGFMNDQSRLMARRRIRDIQQYTRILSASYNIKPADVSPVAAEGLEYVILSTPIDMDVESQDDVDFYHFVYWMLYAFPGHMAIDELRMERVLDVNEATLRQIGAGQPTALVEGSMKFVWRTMVPGHNVRSGHFGGGGF